MISLLILKCTSCHKLFVPDSPMSLFDESGLSTVFLPNNKIDCRTIHPSVLDVIEYKADRGVSDRASQRQEQPESDTQVNVIAAVLEALSKALPLDNLSQHQARLLGLLLERLSNPTNRNS